MRDLINLIEQHQKKSADDLEDYDGEALKPNCIKKIPDDIQYADFCFVWWVGGDDEIMEAKRDAMSQAEQDAKEEDVPHDVIVTGQLCVDPDKIQSLLDNPTDSLPMIHKWNGNYILFDGNHRVVADVLRGQDYSRCWVADLDVYFDENADLK